MSMSPMGKIHGQVKIWNGHPSTSFSLNVVTAWDGELWLARDHSFVAPSDLRDSDIVLDNLGDEWIAKLESIGYLNVKPHG